MNSGFGGGERVEQAREAETRPSPSDPWEAAGAFKGSEQGGWLLSYLDVMTLLFTFFVLLFAYQKAMTVADATAVVPPFPESHATDSGRTIAAKPPAPAETPAPVPQSTQAADGPAVTNAQDGLAPSIAAMKSQSVLREVSRGSAAGSQAREDVPVRHEAMSLKPALEAMARVGRAVLPDAAASEHTAQQLAHLLADEAARKRVDIIRAPHEIRLEFNDAILFDPARAVLRAEGLTVLDRLAPVLAQQVGIVSVEGHTDPVPIANAQFPSNWELSAARATAVTRHLIRKGIPAGRLRAVGMADTRPRSSNATPEGKARNRRVSLVVYLEGVNPPPVPGP